MGMIERVAVAPAEEGWQVDVTLVLTHPLCAMIAVFAAEIESRVGTLPGVHGVSVTFAHGLWSPERMDPDYRAGLSEAG
jgi:metal-sulfur cluster biosynthetic enzyme